MCIGSTNLIEACMEVWDTTCMQSGARTRAGGIAHPDYIRHDCRIATLCYQLTSIGFCLRLLPGRVYAAVIGHGHMLSAIWKHNCMLHQHLTGCTQQPRKQNTVCSPWLKGMLTNSADDLLVSTASCMTPCTQMQTMHIEQRGSCYSTGFPLKLDPKTAVSKMHYAKPRFREEKTLVHHNGLKLVCDPPPLPKFPLL